jgi:hypothetical protein
MLIAVQIEDSDVVVIAHFLIAAQTGLLADLELAPLRAHVRQLIMTFSLVGRNVSAPLPGQMALFR